MRGGSLAGVAVLCALAPAAARANDVTPSGSLVVRWQSNPATCAGYGLCDRSGTLSWRPRAIGGGFEAFGGGRAVSLTLFDGPAVVRSHRATPAGSGVCVESTDGPVELEGLPRHGDTRARLTLGDAPGFDVGRCAGPLPADFAAALPRSEPFRPGAIARRGGTITMRGSAPFAAGPFSGRVVSSLRFRVAKQAARAAVVSGTRRARAAAAPRPPSGYLAIEYAIERFDGQLGFAFNGTRDALCEIFDACGLEGELVLGGSSTSGVLRVSSRRALPRGGRETVADALAALRSGRAQIKAAAWFGGANDEDAGKLAPFPFTETSAMPGDQACHDGGQLEATTFGATVEQGGLRLGIPNGGDEPPDDLRTHCAGPTGRDLPTSLAHGLLPLSALGDQELTVTLAPSEPLSSSVFSGSGSGALQIVLRLIAIEARTR